MPKTKFTYKGKEFKFCSNSRHNRIFKHHLKSLFFETDELEYLTNFVDEDSTILEVGANVGNHAIFYDAFLNPKKIILIEPMQKTIEYLKKNIELNNCKKMDISNLGIGISLDRDKYQYRFPNPNNLGGAQLITDSIPAKYKHVPPTPGIIETKRIDDIVYEQIDFMKIDVEYMEIDVLKSAVNTINKYKPKIFIEINRVTKKPFFEFMESVHYKEAHRIEHVEYINYFMECDDVKA